MRFFVDIHFTGSPPFTVPTGYRRNIMSLIKEGIKNHNPEIYEEYWGKKPENKTKPFTFSVHIPAARAKKGKKGLLEFDTPFIRLHVSSADTAFLMYIYNGLVNTSDYTPFDTPIRLGRFSLEIEKNITGSSILFKILSPVVVRKIENKKGRGYLTCEDEGFDEALFFGIKNLCGHYLEPGFELRREDFSLSTEQCKKTIISHYNEAVSATSGIIGISAPGEVLDLVYRAGIGVKRSQGFGMVEVVG